MKACEPTTATNAAAPVVVALDQPMSRDPAVAGAKAAALARASAAGLPALAGFVVTTSGAPALVSGSASIADVTALEGAWSRLSGEGRRPLVVRSSSTTEDGASQSMAGMFTSVLDVNGWPDFLDAVGDVVRSGGEAPMAVLVQPFIDPAWGGVLFGADPVTGRTDRLVVAAVPGGPDRLVSGEVDGVHMTLSPRGRPRDAADRTPQELRARRTRRALARLARDTAATFGGPQDIEWAIGDDGGVVLLQSRPITALGDEARAAGPLLGPGPVAETFGLPLRVLEEDLWVVPLRDGLREALSIVGTSSARRLRKSPVVVTVGGRVAADLDLLALGRRRRSLLSRLDPRPPARRLKAAWRVGRLRVALPALAADLVGDVDADLRSLPDLDALSAAELLRLLQRSHRTLMALHGYEVLAGLLIDEADDGDHPTAASAALRVLAAERGNRPARPVGTAAGDDDDTLVARHPVLLSLVPPSIGGHVQLPPAPAALRSATASPAPAPARDAVVREGLRLRVRWIHELTGRAALALGERLVVSGALASAGAVVNLRLDELAALVESGGTLIAGLRDGPGPGPPLPAAFRLTADGTVVPVGAGTDDAGRGAGGGRRAGPVHIGSDEAPSPGDVLVVRTLDPALAALLPGLGGLVAETGSMLSHLAILAREYGVPTVVGLPGAIDRFTAGTWVVVDGTTGEVSELESEQVGAA